MPDTSRLFASGQEQATAAWVDHLNEVRLDSLLTSLRQQDQNLRDALASVSEALERIDLEVVVTNRGGLKGMHGFIAEVAEVGVDNARRLISGGTAASARVDDNGPVDLLRGGVQIQQKFVAAGGRLGLGAIAEHLEKYPDFLTKGGRYQIPRDHFETVRELHAMSHEEAARTLTRGGDGPSFRDWERVRAFFDRGNVPIESLEPSHLDYDGVQRGAYEKTLKTEEESLRRTDRSRRDRAHEQARATPREATKAGLVSAGVEGATSFVLAVVEKRRAGTALKDFTSEDWADVAGASGLGALRGGVRGLSVYALTNVTASSAAVASSVVTAAFGIAEQAHELRRGDLTEQQFLENAELVCLEAAVGALSTMIGQAVIPVPVLGAVIGNTVGMVMYRAAATSLSEREASLAARYLDEQRQLDARSKAEHEELVADLATSMSSFLDVLDEAFDPDVEAALFGSVALARELGVAPDELLGSEGEIDAYFLA